MLSFPSYIVLLFLLSPPRNSIHARTTRSIYDEVDHPKNISYVPEKHNYTWHDFKKLEDVRKGSFVDGISKLKMYLRKFGYLDADEAHVATDVFDSSLELAIAKYQRQLGLPVTRRLDTNTLAEIMIPRCGVRDVRAVKRYAYFAGRPRWRRQGKPMVLTYAFSPENTVDSPGKGELRGAFERAFGHWAEVIPVKFVESGDYAVADIKIGFYGGNHGDGEPFDGVLGVLAHAFSPESGRLHLDAAEKWAVDFSEERAANAVDLESVVTHEIGHVLGLAHSGDRESVMYPSLRPRERKVGLRVDDIEGVQALYGSNPNFNLAGFSESDLSSNGGGRRVGENDAVFLRLNYLGGLILLLCLCM